MPEHIISIADAESDLLACAAYLAESIKSRDGHAEAMKSVVPRYLAKGEVDLAAELSNTVDDPFTRDRLLILVAENCAELDDDEYALQLADAIEDAGLQSQARERIALLKAAKGEFEKARDVAQRIDYPDVVFAGIAVKQSSEGDETSAFETLREIGFPGACVFALQTMAAAKLEKSENEKAVELIEKGALTADEIEHPEEKIRSFCDIGYLFIAAGRNDRAIETFDKARSHAETLDNIHRDSLLAAASVGFLRAGSLELADRTLDLVADKTEMATCLLGYSREFWQKDEKAEALDALDEGYTILKSQREAETRDSRARLALFTSIAAQFAGFEKGERAIEIAQQIPDENEQMKALGQIAQILTIQKNDELARQAIRAIPEDASRVFAFIGASDAAGKNDDTDKAKGFLDEAAALAETVPQLASRSAAYNEIAKRLADFGANAKAGEVSQLSLETIAAIRDESSRAVALVDFSVLIEETGLALGEVDRDILNSMVRRTDW